MLEPKDYSSYTKKQKKHFDSLNSEDQIQEVLKSYSFLDASGNINVYEILERIMRLTAEVELLRSDVDKSEKIVRDVGRAINSDPYDYY